MLIWPKFKSYGGKPNVIVDMTAFETPKKRTRRKKY
jgi:hypothetical protein